MNDAERAALLGLLTGFANTLVRLFVAESLSGSFATAPPLFVLQALASTLVSLAVIPGLPLYGAWQMDATESPVRLAVVVGVCAGLGAVVSYPLLTALSVGAPFAEALGIRLVGPYLVNAVSPATYSGVAALAGFLLAGRNA